MSAPHSCSTVTGSSMSKKVKSRGGLSVSMDSLPTPGSFQVPGGPASVALTPCQASSMECRGADPVLETGLAGRACTLNTVSTGSRPGSLSTTQHAWGVLWEFTGSSQQQGGHLYASASCSRNGIWPTQGPAFPAFLQVQQQYHRHYGHKCCRTGNEGPAGSPEPHTVAVVSEAQHITELNSRIGHESLSCQKFLASAVARCLAGSSDTNTDPPSTSVSLAHRTRAFVVRRETLESQSAFNTEVAVAV